MGSSVMQGSLVLSSVSRGASASGESSGIRQRFIEDMRLAGLSQASQQAYLGNVLRFVRRTGVRPQDASEALVESYLRQMIEQGRCAGTVIPNRAAMKFIFCNTLGRDWALFKKRLPRSGAGVCPGCPAISSVAA